MHTILWECSDKGLKLVQIHLLTRRAPNWINVLAYVERGIVYPKDHTAAKPSGLSPLH